VISKHGDDRVQWNEQDAQAGDAEAMAQFEKPNASLHKSVPGARRLSVSKQASRPSE
jgi:hypothetical protein